MMARKSRKHKQPIDQETETWKTALYIRLSVDKQDGDSEKVQTQQHILEDAAAMHPEIRVVGTYIDRGVTGRTFERPAFQQMLCDIQEGKVTCVMVKELSRFGRNAIDSGYYIENYFPLHGIRFISVNDGFDSLTSADAVELCLKNMMHEAYAMDISRKVKTQQHISMKSGLYIGGRAPYGYQKAKDDCHQLVIDSESAPVVRQIFNWASEGVSANIIARQLNEGGILTPGYYGMLKGVISDSKLAGSGKWQTRTVTKILTSEVYIGNLVQGKSKKIGNKQVALPPEEWIVVPNTHKALISCEQFELVQDILRQKAKRAAVNIKVPYTKNVLRGKIFCGHCGKNLNRNRNHEQYFFCCISNNRIARNYCACSPRVKEEKLLDSILNMIQQESAVLIDKQCQIKKSDAKTENDIHTLNIQLLKLRQRLSRNRGFLKGLYQNLVTGMLSDTEYRTMKVNYEQMIQEDLKQLYALEDEKNKLVMETKQLIDTLDKLKMIYSNSQLTAELIEQLIERITVYDEEHIDIKFRFHNAFK